MVIIKLKALLDEKGVKQKELAEALGMRQASISDIANANVKAIPLGTLDKICATLNCTVGDILEYVKEE